ncbi:MAG: response regulator [Deltaproteobacteria bacterium]|nr:response regulator [Deltaproteobacteria bacterium]MBN2688713.1 response regulator [Deltaproteobacteria bacterium]
MKNLSEYNVLVVDDTEANIDLLVFLLGRDYHVAVAMDGESALEVAGNNPPDLILLDVRMPGMNGYEVCERLKANEATKDIHVMFLSANIEEADRRKAQALGAVDFISKPIDIMEIQEKVKNCLMQEISRNKL